jgi:hypothetical protein
MVPRKSPPISTFVLKPIQIPIAAAMERAHQRPTASPTMTPPASSAT